MARAANHSTRGNCCCSARSSSRCRWTRRASPKRRASNSSRAASRTATSTAGSNCPSAWSGSRSSTTWTDGERPARPAASERCRDRGRSQRAARILPGQLQGAEAHSPQVRLRAGATPTATTRTSPRPLKPPQPIDKGLPGPSLLAYVVVSKLGDHLPLYRLENIFARQQVHVARSTMCAWMAAAGELVDRWWS